MSDSRASIISTLIGYVSEKHTKSDSNQKYSENIHHAILSDITSEW
jgi:hypothetical protein